MKTLYLSLFLIIISYSIKAQASAPTKTRVTDSVLTSLKAKKAAADKYINTHAKEMVVFVKIPGKKGLMRVYNEKWPEEVEYTCNILKDKNGKIIYVFQAPFSESGDWDISYEHYFDEDGNVFAFYKDESIFDDNVKGGIVRNRLLKYYNRDFKVINQKSWLADEKGNTIKANKNKFDFRDYKYTIYKSLIECLKAVNLKTF
jgi:hypothetical protein